MLFTLLRLHAPDMEKQNTTDSNTYPQESVTLTHEAGTKSMRGIIRG